MFKKIGVGLALLGGIAFGLFLRFYRPWHSRWGATDDEVTLSMPGDELIEKPTFNVTRAITIGARPEEIWPWIVQIGYGRAGFYSYDLLDNLGKPSADRIIPELQQIEVGTWIPMSGKVSEETAFRVMAFEPNRLMLWTKAASTWAWKLIPINEESTRLIIRLKCHYRWARPTIVTDLILMEIGDFPMMRKLMLGIKQRAERNRGQTTEQEIGYEAIPFPRMRRLETNLARMSRWKNVIRGLVEVDVTQARKYIREEKARTGEKMSFTAFIAACIGRAVAENRQVQAYKNWRGQLILFDEVDVSILVEREQGGQKLLVAHIVRAANTKSVQDIHQEIREAQAQPLSGREVKQVRAITLLPSVARQLLLWFMSKNPHVLKQNMGTVGLTAIGMFSDRGGWGIDLPIHTLGIVVGGIAERPAFVDGHIEPREYLSLTLNFDHGILDDAPAARFTRRLSELIESGYGLYKSEEEVHVGIQ